MARLNSYERPEEAFLGRAQSILKIHTPQINNMSLRKSATVAHCPPSVCECVSFTSVNVWTFSTCMYRRELKPCTACLLYSMFHVLNFVGMYVCD